MIYTQVAGLNEVRELLDELPEHLYDKTKKEFARSVFNVQQNITAPMKTGQNGLQSRSGNLARSIKFLVTGKTLDALKGRVYTKSIYAPLHEEGDIVNAKRAYKFLPGGPYLNIPSKK
jgi:hypothetical protein